ncbi:hypothetical protein UA08_05728 [Talaromyces atroroseus]|uniref:RRM domain-containing protein n=1 Tax=Talaromyces atroroseus TaxID=1441469 RepID=A0A225AXR3_TALAT|nr:hypothetical protein UA08_05728 [Talaromyces atroroseus]OKL59245.1 hypothetical protein UA08_05728 [Talaromyces atroroseus]
MAPEKKDKKRKGEENQFYIMIFPPTSAAAVTVTDLPNKKSKKTTVTAEKPPSAAPKSILKKKEETNGVAKSTTANEPTRKIKPRKRASDFLSDDDDESNKSADEEEDKSVVSKNSSGRKDKKEASSKPQKAKVEAEEKTDNDEVSEEDDDLDDQTAELIKGFESSGDEDASEDEGFDADKAVPRIPDSKKAKRKIQKKLKENTQTDEPGTVYVGRIPHGFYEHQMRDYFSQFGDITRLRLSRNRVTGRSKHYAFIEFASSVVAKIVAETMNNYLMYGHILKCKFVPQEQQHAELWKGSNRRYKRVPWNRIEKQRLDRGKTRDKWAKSIEQENGRRLAKAAKLKELMGYEYDVPGLKAIDAVPVQEKLPAPEAAAEIEAGEKESPAKDSTDVVVANGDDKEADKEAEKAVADEQTPKKKKAKKSKKEKGSETPDIKTTPAKVAEPEQATPSTTPESSTKKAKAKKAKKFAGKA